MNPIRFQSPYNNVIIINNSAKGLNGHSVGGWGKKKLNKLLLVVLPFVQNYILYIIIMIPPKRIHK